MIYVFSSIRLEQTVSALSPAERQKLKRKVVALDRIKESLEKDGGKDVNLIIKDFPEFDASTVWRWIKEARKGDGSGLKWVEETRRQTWELLGDLTVDTEEDAKERGIARIARDIPAMPSPQYLSSVTVEEASKRLDFQVEIHRLYADANMLRDYAIKIDEATGKEKIKNPHSFERSINSRTKIIREAIDVLQQMFNLTKSQEFYDAIIAEIGNESPECQKRILSRLATLNARTGMTMPMRV